MRSSMAESIEDEQQRAAKAFNRILNAPKLNAGAPRTDKHVEEGIKKLRRLILVDGIPHTIVGSSFLLPI